MSKLVNVECNGGVLSITLNRPERRNAITVAMYAVLADAIEDAGRDPAVRLITLSGAGEDFTAGNDLADFMAERPDVASGDLPVWRYLRALAVNEVPLIATVQGNAVGIGTTMLLHCDFVIAEESSRFHLPFVDLGLVPEAASSLLLPRLAGRRRAARHLLLAEPFDAQVAYDMGIASHVVPAGGGAGALTELVAALLTKPAEAMRETQRLLRMGEREAVLERMSFENGKFAERLQSQEVRDAIMAFFAAKASRTA